MCSTYEVTSALRPARRRDSLLADELGATLDYNTEIARYDLLLQARLRPPTLSRTRLLHGRAGHRPPSGDGRLQPVRAGTSRRREVRARPDQRAGSAPGASPCGRARRQRRTRWIVMPSSTSSPSQVLTNASATSGADRRQDSASEQCRVEDSVDAAGHGIADSRRQTLAARQHDVGCRSCARAPRRPGLRRRGREGPPASRAGSRTTQAGPLRR